MISKNLLLRDVLVIPRLIKILLSISKLTLDHPVDFLFYQPFLTIQDRSGKQVIAQGICEDGLYVLRDGPNPLILVPGAPTKASFELWHNRLGHTPFDVNFVLSCNVPKNTNKKFSF